MTIHLHDGDLPAGLDLGPVVAVDSETMGLRPHRDRLCLVQLSAGDGDAHLVRIGQGQRTAPRLNAMLADPTTLKLMHFARFDVAAFLHNLNVVTAPVWCTKIAAKLVRTFTDRHGLRDLAKELIGVEIDKQQQSSDWGSPDLKPEQLAYAASDVLYLHRLKAALEPILAREGRLELAEACFAVIPTRARLDLLGFDEPDIFAH